MDKILAGFNPITLDEMSGIKLMNRTDTKFVTSVGQLKALLEIAKRDYRVQEVDGVRNIPYRTIYFDTLDLDMYLTHEHGHANRQKVRIRSYVNSGLNFLEVKTKDNHKRTKKKRVTVENFDPLSPPEDMQFHRQNAEYAAYDDFLRSTLHYDPETLREALSNRFKRITLVNNAKTERLTIDTGLWFHNYMTGRELGLDNIAIIELKRDGLQPSPILKLLNQLRIKPHGFSKYCMGQALTNDRLTQNRFKARLHNVWKINTGGLCENVRHQRSAV